MLAISWAAQRLVGESACTTLLFTRTFSDAATPILQIALKGRRAPKDRLSQIVPEELLAQTASGRSRP
ncbi:hypothetical protein K426_09765 [Sphingobium sp. TKS]|nr:hypothetical protein K426_09765 [Sphingobium sp. TKS]